MISWQDGLNGAFEVLGGFFILPSIFRLWRDKSVKGVSVIHIFYFSAWGYWNLYYYPHLNQWFSVTGAALLALINSFWALQMIYYIRKGR